MEKVHILHTNDLHSHLENWPKIRRYIHMRKEKLTKKEETVLVVDLGDFSDRVHPLTEATDGRANVSLMNDIHYDAATIGNNEGVGNSKKQLDHLYDEANFDVLLGNVVETATHKQPKWAKSYKIIQTKENVKIALLALTAPFTLTYEPNGWTAYQTDEVLPSLIAEVEDKSDLIVLMSHLGVNEEKRIAERYPEIQVILGSHTHHLFPNGLVVNQTLLAAAGKYGRYVGEVTLTIEGKNLVSSEAEVQPTEELVSLAEDAQEILSYEKEGHQLLAQQKVGKLPYDLQIDFEAEHSLIDIALAGVKEYAETDIAVLSSGLFLRDLPKGIVNKDQLHQSIPHPMHIIKLEMTGRNLIQLVYEMEKKRNFLCDRVITGMGFRGKIFGEIVYSGLIVNSKEKTINYKGQRIQENERYVLATVDHFLFLPFFPAIQSAEKIEMIYPKFLRNVVGQYIEENYPY